VSGWWRRNRVALVAVVLIAPVTVGVVFQKEWGGFGAGPSAAAVEVAAGDDAFYGGTGWRVTGVDRIRWSSAPGAERELPTGTDLVVVHLAVTPGDLEGGESTGCTLELDEGEGDRSARLWKPAPSTYVPYDPDDGASTYCDPSRTSPYELAASFLVPVDAGEDASLRLSVEAADELPRFLRITL
jgi:hypothetical protein